MNAQVIIAGTDLWHDLLAGGQAIQKILLEAGHQATLRVGLGRFSAEQEKTPDVYVINGMAPRIAAGEIEALQAKITAGTGLVTLHATNVTPPDLKGQEGFFGLIGSRFVSHPLFARFKVRRRESHPVMEGIEEFLADDEPYEIEITEKSAKVLATGEWSGKSHPLVYTRTYGKGLICYIGLGHDGRAWANPAFRRMVTQAAVWCAGGTEERGGK